ncbi:MAG: GIY-YIG nuclease family protein [Lachnospiraceae bacterium]|uniref:GIY-YIG nuclease family protein n=1 Tax=Candidatus Weimeria bifida TaxID=2599074 RepID=A0A6N7J0G9_9FIRM|nr:GIY-YIG nuclease family protein [Candidatus Weimeria bifida]RRF96874.1 MAG: GIY-YIG nuclease family protein [Lachnospiraceae bacterium]
MYYTYIVKCSDNSLYTGYTTNLERRVKEHNNGKKGAKYTRSRRPVELVYYEEYAARHDAMSREALIKQLSHREKCQLIEDKRNIFQCGKTE